MLLLLPFLSFSALIHSHEERSFLSFMRTHGLSYTGSEFHLRFGIFLAQSRLIRSFNSGSSSFTLGLNHLTCLTPAEYRSLLSPVHTDRPSPAPQRRAAPDSWDWRDHNAVIGVQDSGQCAASWAIVAVQAQSSQWAIRHSDLIPLSYMQLVDCGASPYGCDGGTVQEAYDWVIAKQNGHFAVQGYDSCTYDENKMATTIVSYKAATSTGDENGLVEAVYNDGVATVGVDASHNSFQLYRSGVYSEPSCSQTALDHSMIVVGYGADGATPYWILQNNWGTSWGERGYMRMVRNHGNMCGIATDTIVPIDQT
jgi:cathepsin L